MLIKYFCEFTRSNLGKQLCEEGGNYNTVVSPPAGKLQKLSNISFWCNQNDQVVPKNEI